MKTLIFCTSYFDTEELYLKRYKKWIDYYNHHPFTDDKNIYLIDDNSDLELIKDDVVDIKKEGKIGNFKEANKIKLQPPNIEPINKRKFSEAMTMGTVLLSCWMTLSQIEKFNEQSAGKVFFKEFQH